MIVAFATCLLFFLGLRIADEFKDFEEDSLYRPYRPVPRGLVNLRELGWVGFGCGTIQLLLALWLAPLLMIVLLAGWLYLMLMSVEFFARDWLKMRPITYLWTHMFIMPIVDFYATACDWIPSGMKSPPHGLFWFLIASFFNGVLIEIGRKIRAKEDEETGVQTYSYLWGRSKAVVVWLGVMLITGICAVLAARRIDFGWQVGTVIGSLFLISIAAGLNFISAPHKHGGKRFELLTGIWTLLLYLSLGLIPLSWHLLKQ